MPEAASRLSVALGDRYRIVRELGAGGMATVYLADDLRHGRRVAIKVLRPDLTASLGGERFLAEIRTTAALQHRNILPLFDSGGADGFLFHVTPFIEGETLRSRLRRETQLPIDQAVDIAAQVADALTFAHGRGIIHRDIKPENILLAADGVFVADFGISKALDDAGGERLTQTGITVGTPLYMSPEQATATEALDARTDLYSLACVLYEMLAGEPPHTGPSSQAILAKRMVNPPPDVRTVRETVPPRLAEVLKKGLAKVPADRHQTVADFMGAVQAALSATPDTAGGRATTRRRWYGVAAVLLTAFVAVAPWLKTVWFSDPPVARIAVMAPMGIGDDDQDRALLLGLYNRLLMQLGEAGVSVVGGVETMLRFQAERATVPEIASRLGVDQVVEPIVSWSGDSVNVDVRLVNGRSEAVLWTGQFGGAARDVRLLLHTVSQSIGSQTGSAPRAATTPRAGSVNPAAQRAYMQGVFYSQGLTETYLQRATEYYQAALEADPEYAPAYAGLSWAWVARQQMGFDLPEDATPIAMRNAERAIELDTLLPEAHLAVGASYGWANWNWQVAEREYRRAIELNPRFGDAHSELSHLLLVMRRFAEAVAHADTAVMLDPFNIKYRAFRGVVYAGTDRLDEARSQFEDILQELPGHPAALTLLTEISNFQRRDSATAVYLEARLRSLGFPGVADLVATMVPASGLDAATRAAADSLARIARAGIERPIQVAGMYAIVHDTARTLDWLERALERHEPNLPYINSGLQWQFLRGTPRFEALRQALNLSD